MQQKLANAINQGLNNFFHKTDFSRILFPDVIQLYIHHILFIQASHKASPESLWEGNRLLLLTRRMAKNFWPYLTTTVCQLATNYLYSFHLQRATTICYLPIYLNVSSCESLRLKVHHVQIWIQLLWICRAGNRFLPSPTSSHSPIPIRHTMVRKGQEKTQQTLPFNRENSSVTIMKSTWTHVRPSPTETRSPAEAGTSKMTSQPPELLQMTSLHSGSS